MQAEPIDSFYQNLQFDYPTRRVTESVVGRLIEYQYSNGSYKMIPQLATKWTQIKPTVWQYALRKGVTFSNGDPFTADDVVASLQTLLSDPKSVYLPFLGGYKAIAVDATHVNFITPKPDAFAPLHIGMLQITDAKYVKQVGAVQEGLKPIGTGPYVVTKFVPGQEIDLAANSHYWGPKPQISKVIVTFNQDAATRISELESGQADLIDGVPPLLKSEVEGLSDARVLAAPTMEVYNLLINSKLAPASNVMLRKAIEYGIDRQQIIDLFKGNAQALYSVIPAGEPGYSADYKPYTYDPAKAKKILAAAGISNPTVVLGHSNGEIAEDTQIAENIQAQLGKIGINVQLAGGPLKTTNEKFIAGQQAGAYLITNGPVYPNPEFIYHAMFGTNSTYSAAFGDPRVDQTLSQLRASSQGAAATVGLYRQVEEIALGQDAFIVPLVQVDDLWGVNKQLVWTPTPDSTYRFASMSFKGAK